MKILLIDYCHPWLEAQLENQGYECVDCTQLRPESIVHQHYDAEGMLVRARLQFPQAFLQSFPKLRWIARFGSGMEHIDVAWAEAHGIRCLSAPEGNRDAVGEHALAMLLALFNHLPRAHQQVRNGQWNREANRGEELAGKTVGIIGYGHMGSAFAEKLKGMKVRILAYDKYKTAFGEEGIQESSLETLQQEADVISIHLPLNEETRHYLNKRFFERLGKPIYLINTSRGDQLVLKDLWDALESGKVLGACLDVLEHESASFETALLSQRDPIFHQMLQDERIIFTPHIAGWTHQSQLKMAQFLLQKIQEIQAKNSQ